MANSSLDRKLIDSLYFYKKWSQTSLYQTIILEGNFQEAQKYTDQLPDFALGFDSSSFVHLSYILKRETSTFQWRTWIYIEDGISAKLPFHSSLKMAMGG